MTSTLETKSCLFAVILNRRQRLVIFQHIVLYRLQSLFSEQLKIETYNQKIAPCFVIDFVVELFYIADLNYLVVW